MNLLMTGEFSLPQRGILIEHVVSSLDLYWVTKSSLIKNLPIFDVSGTIHFSLPLRVYEVELPDWAAHLGKNGKILTSIQAKVSTENSNLIWSKLNE